MIVEDVVHTVVQDFKWGATQEQLDYVRHLAGGYKRVGICEPRGFGISYPGMHFALYCAMFHPNHLTILVTMRRTLAVEWIKQMRHIYGKRRAGTHALVFATGGKEIPSVYETIWNSKTNETTRRHSLIWANPDTFTGGKALNLPSDQSTLIIVENMTSIPTPRFRDILSQSEAPNVQLLVTDVQQSSPPAKLRKPEESEDDEEGMD